MRIAFDFNPILVNRFSGFYSYGTGLLVGFEELEEKAEFLLFHSKRFSSQAKTVRKSLGDWAQLKGTSIKMRWLENFWRWSDFPKLENFTGEFDLYHCCHHLMPPTRNKPCILTVYDLRRYKMPGLYRKSKLGLFELALRRADHFIAISEATKNDLCSLFDIPGEKVDVIHLAADATFNSVLEVEKQKIKRRLAEEISASLDKYLVVFSSPDKRKNISRVIKAFISAQSRLPDNFKLVVVGKPPRDEDIFKLVASGKKTDNIVVTGIIDDVGNLLSCADGLVFASLYEGFGIPILEAFACGVPVITSNCSSMPEVAGEAALYVDPYSIESIAQAMTKICSDVAAREKLVKAGFSRVQEFSWRKAAAETIKVYKKLL